MLLINLIPALVLCHQPAEPWHGRLGWCKVLLTGRALTTRANLWPLQENSPPIPLPLPSACVHSLLAAQAQSRVEVQSSRPELYRSCLLPGDGCPSFFHRTICPLCACRHLPTGIKNMNPAHTSLTRKDTHFAILVLHWPWGTSTLEKNHDKMTVTFEYVWKYVSKCKNSPRMFVNLWKL